MIDNLIAHVVKMYDMSTIILACLFTYGWFYKCFVVKVSVFSPTYLIYLPFFLIF